MAVNKNFVVKNGLEVNTDLLFADSSTRSVGVGSTSPNFDLDVRGGIGATDLRVTGFTTLTKDLQVGASGSAFYVSNTNNLVGVGTSVPAFLMDIRSSVSSGQTALYVKGDMRVTGDINLDDLTIDDLTVTGIATYKPDGAGGSPDSWIDIDYTGNTTTGGGTTVGFGSTAYFVDNAKVVFGAGEDLEIYHNSASSFIDNSTGDLYLKTSGSGDDVYIESVDDIYLNAASKSAIHVFGDGAVDLYYNNTRRFATTHGGVVVAGGSSITGISTIQSTAQNQINATTGALQVAGGAGIAKNLFVGGGAEVTGIATITGAIDANSTTQSSSSTTGAATFAGGVGVAKNLFVGGGAEITGITTVTGALDANSTSDFNGVVTVSNTTQSSSKDTGAIIVEGGVGIEKNIFVGGGASITGITSIYANGNNYAAFIENPHATGNGLRVRAGDADDHRPFLVEDKGSVNLFAVYGGGGVDINVGVVTARNTTQSSSSTNGAFQIKGGASVSKNLFVGGGVSVGAAFTVGSGIGVTTILDQDDMAANSATALASQQSIKAYVDTQITAEDLDFSGDSGTGAVDLDSQTLAISGTASEIKTVASGQSLTISLPDDVIVGNGFTVSGTTQSSSKDTGALVLQGGAGIEKNLFVGGGAEVTGLTTITGILDVNATQQNQFNTGSGALQVAGGVGIEKNIFVGGGAEVTGLTTITGVLDANDTTQSSSSATGAAKFAGGVGVAKNLFVGGGAEITGITTITGALDVNSTSDFANDVTFAGTNKNIFFDKSQDELNILGDASNVAKITFGDDQDLQIYKGLSAGGAFIHNAAGTLNITQNSGTIKIDKNTGDEMAHFTVDGSVQLFHNSLERVTTTVDGADIAGTGSIKVPVGTTAQRNSSPADGDIRYNSTLNSYEGYGNSAWGGLGGGTEIDTSVSSTSATSITTFAHASYRSASIRVQIVQGSAYQVGRYLLIHDGTTVTIIEESAIATGSMLGTITAAIVSANVVVSVNMGSSSSATVTTIIDKITV